MSEIDPADSNPNAGGPQGLRGGMGVSSERTGPDGGTPAESVDEGIQGTGTKGTATTSTEGTMDTERVHSEDPAEGRSDIGTSGADTAEPTDVSSGPEMDDRQQAATQEWRDSEPAAREPDADASSGHPQG